jgi:hypothetical protein
VSAQSKFLFFVVDDVYVYGEAQACWQDDLVKTEGFPALTGTLEVKFG